MGLDMYLEKRHYVKNWRFMTPEQLHQVTVLKGGLPTTIKPERISVITEEVCCWRKANQIHRWFVKNIQGGKDDCRDYIVEFEKLQELLRLVEEVLGDVGKAPGVLPTGAGFFFGSTEYGEDYLYDLRYTKETLEALLAEPDAGRADYYYRASW